MNKDIATKFYRRILDRIKSRVDALEEEEKELLREFASRQENKPQNITN